MMRLFLLSDRGLTTQHAEPALKGTKREKLHAMHVKELIKTNYSEW